MKGRGVREWGGGGGGGEMSVSCVERERERGAEGSGHSKREQLMSESFFLFSFCRSHN